MPVKSLLGFDVRVDVNNVGVLTEVDVLVGRRVRVGVGVKVLVLACVVVGVSFVEIEGRTNGVEVTILVYAEAGVEVLNQEVPSQLGAEPVLIATRTKPIAKSRGRISIKLNDFFMRKLYATRPGSPVEQKSF